MVRDEHRHTRSFLKDFFQGVQLLVVDELPLWTAVYDRRACRNLKALHGLGGGVQCLDLRAFQIHEHLLFHVFVQHLRGRRQFHFDQVDDWFLQVEPIRRVNGDAHVAQRLLDLLLRLLRSFNTEACVRGTEPALLKRIVGAP
ncbi:hypothetical protein D3C85_1069490 [compost metagenome]